MIRLMRLTRGEDQVMPAWQGMQYLANMFSGAEKLELLDNARYPKLKCTKVVDYPRMVKNGETKGL